MPDGKKSQKKPPPGRNGNQLSGAGPGRPPGRKYDDTIQAEALGMKTTELRDIKKAARVKFETLTEQALVHIDDVQTKTYEQNRHPNEEENKAILGQLEIYKVSVLGKGVNAAVDFTVNIPIEPGYIAHKKKHGN